MQEHLAWLDREIAAGSGPAVAPPATPPAVPDPARPQPSPADADALIAQYTATPESLHKDVRRGCLLYFALASLAVISLVAVLYFALSR